MSGISELRTVERVISLDKFRGWEDSLDDEIRSEVPSSLISSVLQLFEFDVNFPSDASMIAFSFGGS